MNLVNEIMHQYREVARTGTIPSVLVVSLEIWDKLRADKEASLQLRLAYKQSDPSQPDMFRDLVISVLPSYHMTNYIKVA